jgi:hypothetical protein
MLTFIIPVKSKLVTTDWDHFGQLLEKTLRSICNQIDINFKVVVVCHETPKTTFRHKNLYYLHVNFKPPVQDSFKSIKDFYKAKEIDKGKKILFGTNYAAKEFNTDYVMTVDSDDYISNRISNFVNNSNIDIPGWYIKKGYIHVKGRNFLVKTFKFNYLCGSSIIVKPKLVQYFIGIDSIFYFDHRITKLNNDVVLHKFPFAAGIYNVGNGENIFMSRETVKEFSQSGKWISLKGLKRLYLRLKNYRLKLITSRLQKEFNF